MKPEASVHEHWSSRFAFIMASVGGAVGLGNFWRFPYETGQNGGGAFVLIYVAAILLIGIPLILSELLIGRRAGRAVVGSVQDVAAESGATKLWAVIGWMGILTGFLVLSYYSVIAGWVMAYIPKAASGFLAGAGKEDAGAVFENLTSDPRQLMIWHTAFTVIVIAIVGRGLHKGIEWAANILMPAFFVMLLLVVGYAVTHGDLAGATAYMFEADFSRVLGSTEGFLDITLAAIGQAFFSIGLGMGFLITYGAYLDKRTGLPGAAFTISAADTAVAILAGLAMFPLIFANGIDPAEGPGIMFVALPLALADFPLSGLMGGLFFTLAFFAALTSGIALLEVIVSWAEEHRGVRRSGAAIVAGAIAWGLGIAHVLSFSEWSAVLPPDILPGLGQRNIFGLVDFVASNLLLPLGGVLIALFSGWAVRREIAQQELGLTGAGFRLWRFFVRFVIPLAVGGVLVVFALRAGFGIDVLAPATGS